MPNFPPIRSPSLPLLPLTPPLCFQLDALCNVSHMLLVTDPGTAYTTTALRASALYVSTFISNPPKRQIMHYNKHAYRFWAV